MPCMGPTKDDEIAGLVVDELKKIDRFDWSLVFGVYDIRRAVEDAITRRDRGVKPWSWVRTHEIACLCYGMLCPKQPGEIDWDKFRADLDDAIWTFDAADF